MKQQGSDAAFLTAVDQSFLTEGEKAELRSAAAVGVDQELWNRFNDQLIASIVRSQADQRRFVQNLDSEIDRYTVEYEKEKSVLDRRFRDELSRVSDRSVKKKKWGVYERQIRELQSRFVKEVRATSTSILHDVILATVPIDNGD